MEGVAVLSLETGLCLGTYENSKGKSLNIHLDEDDASTQTESLFTAASMAAFMHLVNINADEAFQSFGSIKCWIRDTEVNNRDRKIAVGVHNELKVALLFISNSTLNKNFACELANVLLEEVVFWMTQVNKQKVTLSKHLKVFIRQNFIDKAIGCAFEILNRQARNEEICENSDWIQVQLTENVVEVAPPKDIRNQGCLSALLYKCGQVKNSCLPTKIHPMSTPASFKTYHSLLKISNQKAPSEEMSKVRLKALLCNAGNILERTRKPNAKTGDTSATRIRFNMKDGSHHSITSIENHNVQAIMNLKQDKRKGEKVESKYHIFNYDIFINECCSDMMMNLHSLDKSVLRSSAVLERTDSN